MQLRPHDGQGHSGRCRAAAEPVGRAAAGADGHLSEQLQLRLDAAHVGQHVRDRVLDRRRQTVRRRLLPQLPPSGSARHVDHAAHAVRRLAGLPAGCPRGHGRRPDGYGSGSHGGAEQYATDFPSDGIILRPYNALTVTANPTTGACSQFASMQYSQYQYQDGAIPSASTLMRFGLMTFDQDPSSRASRRDDRLDPHRSSARDSPDPQTTAFGAFAGMWSYFPGWDSGRRVHLPGQSPDGVCDRAVAAIAVGARNPAAPPWEGRMMRFPSTNDLAAQETNNQNVSNVVLATRPYGATPLAGMFADAQYYLWNDPKGPEQSDPLVHCGQRPQYIIVLTDGVPNLDLQPDCSAPPVSPDPSNPMAMAVGGHCPFPKPEVTAETLNTATGGSVHSVTTFVLGSAVSSVKDGSVNVQCSSLVVEQRAAQRQRATNTQPTRTTASTTPAASCSASRSPAPRTTRPRPRPTSPTPRATCRRRSTTSWRRSHPTRPRERRRPSHRRPRAPSPTRARPPRPRRCSRPRSTRPRADRGRATWCGRAINAFSDRRRTPSTPSPTPPRATTSRANLNSHTGSARQFIAFQPDTRTGVPAVDATATIRPYVTATVGDGIGLYSATMLSGPAPNVVPNITAAALGINQPCAYVSSSTHAPVSPGLSTAACATMTLDYTFGQPSFTGNPGDFPFVSRYDTALGDIYHAAPAVIPARRPLPFKIRLTTGFQSACGRRATRSCTRRPTTASSTRSGPTRRSSRTTSAGRCSCRG